MFRRAALVCLLAAAGSHGFDFETGNSAVEVIIPALIPWIYADISATGGDAPLVLRLTTLVTNSWFDAVAPYHSTAVGVYSRIDRRPEAERNNTNMNTAMFYAARALFTSVMPNRVPEFDAVMLANGLDPLSSDRTDLTTPIGIGTHAGTQVAAGRSHDGMNAVGDYMKDRHFEPFKDTTGYTPVNTAYSLNDASRWQPDMQRKGAGLYKIQQFVTPQWGITEPYAYSNPNAWQMPEPVASNVANWAQYKQQADEVLAASASLTEEQMLEAELFDNKVVGIGGSALFMTVSRGLSLQDFVHMDFLTNMAAFDAGIFVWNEKRRWDGVRPFSAIKHIYGDATVQGWGGPGQGTVDMKASDWRALFEEADHPEYPSASTCFCTAHAQAARKYFGSDDLGYPVTWAAGTSMAEAGITPSNDTTVVFPTWTSFSERCGQSRVWGGVHFQAAVDSSLDNCNRFGDMAFDYFSALVNGTAPARGPSRPLPIPCFYDNTCDHDDNDDNDSHGKGKGHNKHHGKGKHGKWSKHH